MPREIDALRVTYKHPHLIQLYEVFRSETRIYLVMEYAPNGDILSYINECVLETGCAVKEETARRLFKQTISGVSHCHQLNVVHRDLKCENILLDENDNVKISDFGFACRFPTNRCNMLSTFCGSYAYAAPEILSAKNYDGKLADIWSLGVVLYALVNGRLPFNDQNLNTLLEQTRRKLNFQPWVSVECVDLIRKLLRTRPLTRLRMHEIITHPWVRKHLNIKKVAPFTSSQAFLKVIQESSEENYSDSRQESKQEKFTEPKLMLKPNGETVRFDSKLDKKSDKAKGKESQASKPHTQSQTGQKVAGSPLRPNFKSAKSDVMPGSGTSLQHKPGPTRAADSSRMRNLYRRILRPSLGTEYVFEIVENEHEKEQLLQKRLQSNMRGKPSPSKTPRLGVRRRAKVEASAVPPHDAISSPSPRLTKAYTPSKTPNKIKSDTADDTDSLAGYATTLIPVNVKEKTFLRTRGGTPERESRTRISYRLGLSPTPTPAGHADAKISPSDRKKHSQSEPASWKRGKAKASDFINVHGKTELWKQALSGTLQKEVVKNDLRLESPSPRASPVAALTVSNGSSSGKYKAKMRILARRNLLHSIMLKPDPEVRASEILNQLQNNLPRLNDAAA
ncbi:MAP/microtubule affinity-regulating kinase 3-like isoform X2 [Acanthaster planci]|nr:MAP/microtubule affinity-regulating kinase 3-like isoform X2 [Acanthaster planci]